MKIPVSDKFLSLLFLRICFISSPLLFSATPHWFCRSLFLDGQISLCPRWLVTLHSLPICYARFPFRLQNSSFELFLWRDLRSSHRRLWWFLSCLIIWQLPTCVSGEVSASVVASGSNWFQRSDTLQEDSDVPAFIWFTQGHTTSLLMCSVFLLCFVPFWQISSF